MTAAANFELMEALQVIERARTVFTWGGADKPGKPKPGSPGKPKQTNKRAPS